MTFISDMKSLCFAFAFSLISSAIGCSLLQTNESNHLPSVILLQDSNQADHLPSDGLEIQSAKIVGNTLSIEVAYGGGCKEHVFELYVSPALAKSLPPKGSLILTHDANQDGCYAFIRKSLEFDLLSLKDFFYNEKTIIFFLALNKDAKVYKEGLEYKR
jgi:hypothetical protein